MSLLSVFLVCSFVAVSFISHVWVKSCGSWLLLTGVSHLAGYSPGPPMCHKWQCFIFSYSWIVKSFLLNKCIFPTENDTLHSLASVYGMFWECNFQWDTCMQLTCEFLIFLEEYPWSSDHGQPCLLLPQLQSHLVFPFGFFTTSLKPGGFFCPFQALVCPTFYHTSFTCGWGHELG